MIVSLDNAPAIDWSVAPARARVSATLRIQTVPKDSILAIGNTPNDQTFTIPLDTEGDLLRIRGYRIVNGPDGDVNAPFDLVD